MKFWKWLKFFNDVIWYLGAPDELPGFGTPGKLEFSQSSSQEQSDKEGGLDDSSVTADQSSMAIEEVDMDLENSDWGTVSEQYLW